MPILPVVSLNVSQKLSTKEAVKHKLFEFLLTGKIRDTVLLPTLSDKYHATGLREKNMFTPGKMRP